MIPRDLAVRVEGVEPQHLGGELAAGGGRGLRVGAPPASVPGDGRLERERRPVRPPEPVPEGAHPLQVERPLALGQQLVEEAERLAVAEPLDRRLADPQRVEPGAQGGVVPGDLLEEVPPHRLDERARALVATPPGEGEDAHVRAVVRFGDGDVGGDDLAGQDPPLARPPAGEEGGQAADEEEAPRLGGRRVAGSRASARARSFSQTVRPKTNAVDRTPRSPRAQPKRGTTPVPAGGSPRAVIQSMVSSTAASPTSPRSERSRSRWRPSAPSKLAR